MSWNSFGVYVRVTLSSPSHLRVFAIAVVVGYTVSAITNFFVQGLSHFMFPAGCTSTLCFELLGIGGVGWVIVVVSVLGIFRSLVSAGYIQWMRHVQPSLQPGSGPEDERLLAVANELLATIKLRGTRSFVTLSWAENAQWYWITSGGGMKRNRPLVLWSGLRGRLSSDYWRTMLRYLLIGGRPHLRSFVDFVFLLFPFFGVALIAVTLDALYGNLAGAFFTSIAGPIVGPWILLGLFPTARKAILRQDTWIARSIGRDSLLSLFVKIDSLGLPEIENAKNRTGWIARLWPVPNITERIDNLQAQEVVLV